MEKQLSVPLSANFLRAFSFLREPFAVLNGRLYTLNVTNGNYSGQDALHYYGHAYSLDQSEELFRLEDRLFTAQKDAVKKAMDDYINEHYVRKLQSGQVEVSRLRNYLESMKDSAVERFIMVDVFNTYNMDSNVLEEGKVDFRGLGNIPEVTTLPSIADLRSRENSLEALIQRPGLLAIEGMCYSLARNGGNRDENQGYVVFDGVVYGLREWISLEQLCRRYTERLVERVRGKADEHGKKYGPTIARLEEGMRALNESIRQRSMSAKTEAKSGEIGFRKLKEGEYLITLTLEPYIIKKGGTFHEFQGVTVGTVIRVDHSKLTIGGEPGVLSPANYNHMFVWSDGKICYNFPTEAWKRIVGAALFEEYDFSDRTANARRISRVMDKARQVLEYGYFKEPFEDFTPVKAIERCNCRIPASNREEAVRYAESRGINPHRIFDNR